MRYLRQAAIIVIGWALRAEDFVESRLYSCRRVAALVDGQHIPSGPGLR